MSHGSAVLAGRQRLSRVWPVAGTGDGTESGRIVQPFGVVTRAVHRWGESSSLGPRPAQGALVSLLALNGLRVSEATGANIEALGVERGHRRAGTTGGKGPAAPVIARMARYTPF